MLFILNQKLEIVDTLSNEGSITAITPFFDDGFEMYLETGAEAFTFSTMASTEEAQHLVIGNYIAFPYEGEHKLFQISDIKEDHSEDFIKTIYCEMAGIELINEIVRPIKYTSTGLNAFVESVLTGTTWEVGFIDLGLNTVADIDITEYTNVYSVLQEHIYKTYGGELVFTVRIAGGSIAAKYINVYEQRGSYEGFRFEYSSNLTSIGRSANSDNLATALIGVGKDNLTFKSIETSDKPLNQDFITDDEAYNRWSKNGEHILGVFKCDAETATELLELTRAELAKRKDPQVTYELKTELLGKDEVNLGDTVLVIDNEFNPPIHLSARVSKLTVSFTDPSKNECILSNFREVTSSIIKDMRDMAKGLEGYVDSQFPIGESKIQDNAVTAPKIGNGQITNDKIDRLSVNKLQVIEADIGNAQITNAKIKDAAITTAKIQDAQITNAKIDRLSANKLQVVEADIVSAAITNAKIADASITTAKIQDAQISNAKIKDAAITSAKIADGEISNAKIANAAITTAKIENGSITTALIGTGAINTAQIADGSITNAKIVSLTADKIATSTLDTSKVTIQGANGKLRMANNRIQVFDNQAVPKERVSMGDVNGDGTLYGLRVRGADGTTILLDENGVKKEGITDGSIDNSKISTDADINGSKLLDNSIAGGKLVVDSITAREVAAKTITANEITANTITAAEIKAATITAAQIAAGTIDATRIKAGTITTSQIDSDFGKNLDISSNTSITSKVNSSDVYTKNDIDSKGYQTSSQVQQTVNTLEIKFQENGGYNLLYNSEWKRLGEKWTEYNTGTNGINYNTSGLSCPNGCGVGIVGEIGKTKYVQQIIPLNPNEDQYTISSYLYTGNGTDGTANKLISLYLEVEYTDGTVTYITGCYNDSFNVWQRKSITINKTTEKTFKNLRVYIFCRDTTRSFYASQIMVESGNVLNPWSPNPNEISDGIITIDKDGITVSNSGSDTITQIDSGSFRVEDKEGGTIAKLATISDIPILNSSSITAENIFANNVVNKSTVGKILYVDGINGNDTNDGSSTYKLKTVQKAIDMLEDVLSEYVTIYVYNSVPGFEIKNISGKGRLTIYLEDSVVVNGNILVQGVTNQLNFSNQSGLRKATLKGGLSIYNCRCVDIYALNFKGLASETCNIYIENTNYCAVNSCDLGGLATNLMAAIKVKASLLWLHGCIGSNINDVVGQYAFSHVMMSRTGTYACPDYLYYLTNNYDASGRIQSWGGATFTKTPSAGWDPAYTPTAKTQQWTFNKIWSDETLNGYSDKAELIQGYYSGWATGRWTGYMQMTDDFAAIRTAIAGGTNLSGRIYVQRTTSTGNSTDSILCLYGSDGTAITTSTLIDRGQGVWVTLTAAVVAKIQSGAIKYFYLKADTSNSATYFKCESNAKIELTYTK